MTNNHQWTRFQKGRLKIKACASCGEMSLPSNSNSECVQGSISNSPIAKAGYTIAEHSAETIRTSSFAA